MKPLFLTCISLLMSAILYTGCSSSCNHPSNSELKTIDDLVRVMKQCKGFADVHHVNKDSLLRCCQFTTGNPPVVVLNDTVYIYFGQGDTAGPLSTNTGNELTQIRATYFTGPNLTQQSWTYIGIDSARTVKSYGYRIAIPLIQYTRPTANSKINLIETTGPGMQQGSGAR